MLVHFSCFNSISSSCLSMETKESEELLYIYIKVIDILIINTLFHILLFKVKIIQKNSCNIFLNKTLEKMNKEKTAKIL